MNPETEAHLTKLEQASRGNVPEQYRWIKPGAPIWLDDCGYACAGIADSEPFQIGEHWCVAVRDVQRPCMFVSARAVGCEKLTPREAGGA